MKISTKPINYEQYLNIRMNILHVILPPHQQIATTCSLKEQVRQAHHCVIFHSFILSTFPSDIAVKSIIVQFFLPILSQK